MQLLKKLNYIFDKKQKQELIGVFILITIGSVLELLGVSVILPFVNAVISTDSIFNSKILCFIYHSFGFDNTNGFIIFLAILIIIVYFAKNVFLIYMYDVQYKFTFNNQRKLSTMMMRKYISQPYSYHLLNGSEKMIQHITKDVDMFMAAVSGVISLATEMFVCMVIAVFLFITDKSITIGLLLVMMTFIWLYFLFIKGKVKAFGIEVRNNNESINKTIIESFGGIKEVKYLGREKHFIDNYDKYYSGFSDSFRKYQVLSVILRPIMETICIIGMLSVVILKIARGVSMSYFIPTLSLFVVAAFRMLPSFSRMSSFLSQIVFNKSAVDFVYSDLMIINSLSDNNYNETKQKFLDFEKEISIENVSFSYSPQMKEVLTSVNMKIRKNESIGLIGPSGQGKTTLADIILGLLVPTNGSVKVDGVNISDNLNSWHKKIGYIPQNIFLCNDTIRSNIAFGICEDDIDDDKIWGALEEAQLVDFVKSLEEGVNTVVGERGVRLSGGQRQRIGIARALYHNPDILVLDEATSALDNETETAVMEAISRLMGNKTLIIIAHRLSTIKNCDYIYQVSEGNVSMVENFYVD